MPLHRCHSEHDYRFSDDDPIGHSGGLETTNESESELARIFAPIRVNSRPFVVNGMITEEVVLEGL